MEGKQGMVEYLGVNEEPECIGHEGGECLWADGERTWWGDPCREHEGVS